MMHGREKLDEVVVPAKPSNKSERSGAETGEGRTSAKGNPQERNALRTQSRTGAPNALARVREVAKKDRKQRFTALLHHVYDIDRLRQAYFALQRDATAGIDGETWRHYGLRLEEHLRDLSERLKRGAYRASPVRRAYIPKADGRHARYYGVPGNGAALQSFRHQLSRLWGRSLRRRGQRRVPSWQRLWPHIDRWLPHPRICHPWPSQRLAVTTQGKSRMR